MNESEFEELTNLYFDREISDAELKCLKKELAANVNRRHEFKSRYRLHKATCSALSGVGMRLSDRIISKSTETNRTEYHPSLKFGLAMAACLLVLLTTSILIMRESVNDVDTFLAETSGVTDEAYDAANPKPDLPFKGNLSSQLRLAGLTPDIVPANQQLSRVDTEALRQREAHLQNVIEKIDQYKVYSAISRPQLVEYAERNYEADSSNYWPKGFKSSLASFK